MPRLLSPGASLVGAPWPRLAMVALLTFVAALLRAQTGVVLVRHAPSLSGNVDGSVQVMLPEGMLFSAPVAVTGDLLVPGTPTVQLNGRPNYGGTLDGTGSAAPSNYGVTINTNATLRHVIRRTDPVALPVVNPAPRPGDGAGTVAGQFPGSLAALNNLTVPSNTGPVTVAPGTYGTIAVNSNSRIVLGVAGATRPVTYNVQQLLLASGSGIDVAGPVIVVTYGSISFAANASAGDPLKPEWLQLRVAAGGIVLNSNASLSAMVQAPAGLVTLASNSRLTGGVVSDRLIVNTNAVLTARSFLPPTVSLTAPADGFVGLAPASVTLAASVVPGGLPVSSVDFYVNGALVGTRTDAPYQLPLTALPAGSYAVRAVATDLLGQTATSATSTFIVNARPSVQLTTPPDGSVFEAPAADIIVSAQASDSDGSVAQVEFFANGSSIGVSTGGTFAIDWTNVAAGNYTLTAIATDNRGATTTSAPITLVVNSPPAVNITAPLNGAVATAPATVTVRAAASDSDGSITQVQFYQGPTLIGTRTGAPYEVTVTNLSPGEYNFTAVATDNRGSVATSAPVEILVNAPPQVAWVSPAAGSSVAAPGTFTLRANADDTDGAVTSVTFFKGATPVGTVTAAPYQVTVSGLAVGDYVFSAVATDDHGATASSAPVSLNVHTNHAPVISLTAPANGATFTSPATIALTASAFDDDGTIAKVEFYRGSTLIGTALTAPYQFNWGSVSSGSYSITAVATDNLGAQSTSTAASITVSDPAPATIAFDSSSSGTTTVAASSFSWTHTLNAGPGTSRALVVGVVSRGSTTTAASVSGVTFNGVAMLPLAASVANAGTSTVNRSQLFYLLDAALPAAGAYPIQVTFASSQSTSNSPLGGAIVLTNVAQTAPTAFSNSSGTGTSNAISTTVAAGSGSWVVDTIGVGSTSANILTNTTGMTSRFSLQGASAAAGATKIGDATGSVTMAWRSATARQVHSLAVFTPALSVLTPPSISQQPQPQSVYVGANVTLTVTANGTAPLSYQWYRNGNPVSGGTSSTLSLNNLQTTDTAIYSVIVSNSVGSVPSDGALVTVTVQAPSITGQPQPVSVNAGQPFTLSVTATGSAPLTYQWFNGVNPIGGATSSSYSVLSAQGGDSGSYTVQVTNSAGTAVGGPAAVAVNTGPVAPSILVPPASQSVGVGTPVTFAVAASGSAPLSYQWRKDGTDIPDATGAALAFTSVQFGDAGSYTVRVSNSVSFVVSAPAVLTVNALTSPSARYNLTGFATAGAGTTGGGVIPETDAAYRKVYTALDLANAIVAANKTAGAVKVIEIMNDLDLGWNEVGSAVQNLASSPFRSHAAPKIHPVLLSTGMSLLDIKPKSGLTIFSANGATIRHCNFNIKSASNIIVRNLRFDENWEWDESTKGKYDSNDWDFITLGNGGAATNIWVDHCTFTKSYDGIADFKAGTQYVTFSWCRYVGDDGATNPNSWVRLQINALEANKAAYAFYNFLRTHGFTVEDIVAISQGHDKGHLMGSNSLDSANATLSATFHHQWFRNVWDRCVPRLRAGNVHNYDIYVDDTDVLAARRMRDAKALLLTTSEQNTLNNTYSFRPPVNGSISTEGGALLLESSVYINCLTPLRNNQTDPSNSAYTGKILALDSIYHFDNTNGTSVDVRGNSTDAGNPMGPFQAPVIPFSWNLTGNQLPYTYTVDDPATLLPLLQAGSGAGTITWSKENWLKTTY